MRAVLLAAACSAAGCMSFVTLDSARTAGRGETQVLFAPSIYVHNDDARFIGADLLVRHGVADRVDVGVRVHPAGVMGDVKIQLRRSRVDIALAPAVGYGSDVTWAKEDEDPSSGFEAALPLSIGIDFATYQLVLTPQVHYQRVPSFPTGILSLGGTIAVGNTTGPGFQMYPALAIWKATDLANFRRSVTGPGAVVVQPALVLKW